MPFVKLPKHLNALKGHMLRQSTVRWKLSLAALMTVPDGTLQGLAKGAGAHPTTLSNAIKAGYIDGSLCIKLEKFCGRAEFPRHWFNPELYERETAEA